MRPLLHTLSTIFAIAAIATIASGCAIRSDEPSVDDAGSTAESARSEEAAGGAPAGESGSDADSARADPADDLPISQLAGELIMTKLVGPTASPEELAAARKLHLGGVILFGWNVVDQQQLTALVRSLDAARQPAAMRAGLPPHMLVSVDQEGGPIRNVPFAPPAQTQPQIASGSVAEARSIARETGTALAATGVSMDLGPVADLGQAPNRTMAFRSFGDDPSVAGSFVAATVEGLQAGGVAAAAKHFPGFGASTANSDDAVAHVDRSRAQLRTHELVPFRAAIEAGTDVVMVSHGVHRTLGSRLPGTVDPAIATTLLRDELGFTGVAMTDSMNARGFREAWGDTVPRACPAALEAGIDLILLTGSLETARLCRDRILSAVREGSLDEQRVREAARRVIDLRQRRATGAGGSASSSASSS